MKNILITGISGDIGTSLADAFGLIYTPFEELL